MWMYAICNSSRFSFTSLLITSTTSTVHSRSRLNALFNCTHSPHNKISSFYPSFSVNMSSSHQVTSTMSTNDTCITHATSFIYPRVSFGTYQLGDEATCRQAMTQAFMHGYISIDTAAVYSK